MKALTLSSEPGNIEARSNRGRSRLGLKLYREARADFASILASPGTDPGVKSNAQLNVTRIDAYLAAARLKARAK